MFYNIHGQFGNYHPIILAIREIQAVNILSCAMLSGSSGKKPAETRALASCTTAASLIPITRSYILFVAALNDPRSFLLPPPVSSDCYSF